MLKNLKKCRVISDVKLALRTDASAQGKLNIDPEVQSRALDLSGLVRLDSSFFPPFSLFLLPALSVPSGLYFPRNVECAGRSHVRT